MSIPLVRLQSLDFVRGFVAVGRHMSITLAARELCLTQSAISRQVQALEDALGFKLLVRGHRALAFTPEGERLFRTADAALQQLQDVLGALDRRGEAPAVTLTASIGVTGLWLLPRLASLQAAHPEVDVRVAASDRVLDLRHDGVDIAIRYAPPGPGVAGAERLFGEEMLPVAHPSLGLAGRRLREVLAGQVLLEFDDARRPWLRWSDQLAALGLPARKPRRLLRFNQYDQVIHAAIAGQGLALGRRALVEPMLRDGRLEALAWGGTPLQSDHAYWLIVAGDARRADVASVAAWIRAEAGEAQS
jgi:LysR family glycine cleavage system transcriptional activator